MTLSLGLSQLLPQLEFIQPTAFHGHGTPLCHHSPQQHRTSHHVIEKNPLWLCRITDLQYTWLCETPSLPYIKIKTPYFQKVLKAVR